MSQTKNVLKRMMHLSLLASVGFAALLYGASPSLAAGGVAPSLGTAWSYTVLGTNSSPTVGTVTCTDTGPGTAINGDVGSTFTSITNTGCTINGAIVAPVLPQVVTDFDLAYGALDSQNPTCDGVIPTTSTTLPPGVYCSVAGTTMPPVGVTFTLNGNASDVWVFKIGTSGFGALTGTNFRVVMGGTAQACNVYWRTAEAATMTDSDFIGTILAGTAITSTRGSYVGRAMATTDVTVTDAAPMTFAGCAAPPTVTVTKVSNFSSGGGGTFNFTGNNGFASQNITTTTTGVLVVGATQTLTAPGAITTITESAPPAGYTLASIVCTGLGALGTATQDLTTRTVTLDAAATVAGAAISCIFTNNYIAPAPPTAPPTVTVTKVSVGGVGTFSFSGDNGFGGPHTIMTLTSGVGVAGATQTLTTPGATTITESAPLPAGYTLTSIACTGLGAGSATPNLSARSVVLDAVAGTAIACTFTNVAQGSITINKVAQGGNRTFNFTSTGTGISPTPFSITTVSGNGSQLFSGLAPGLYTVAETVPLGWNLSTLTCIDPTSNSTGNVGTLTATINLAAGESVSCTFTDNLPAPTTTDVPTLSEWGMIIFMVLVGLMSIYYLRRQKAKA